MTEHNVEMGPHKPDVDHLLRRLANVPVPTLPPDFDQRIMRKISRQAQPLNRYSEILLIGYGLISAASCALIMHGQGLHMGLITGLIIAPLAMLAAARPALSAALAKTSPDDVQHF